MIALEPASSSEATLSVALTALKATVQVDLAEFRREVGWRLPSALESVSAADIRQHLGPFLEDTFRNWAERESREVQEALAVIAERALTARPRSAENERESLNGPDSRLTRPTLDVSTFAIDASVVAALALGVGTLFANVAVGGLFLLAAPTLATFGRGRGERALRKHAAESALKSVDDAVAKLGAELERVIDDFSLGLVD
jgi:hypothetical protein